MDSLKTADWENLGREGWNVRTREEVWRNKWGQQGSIRGPKKGPDRDPVGGTAVVPRFDVEREFSRKKKSIFGFVENENKNANTVKITAVNCKGTGQRNISRYYFIHIPVMSYSRTYRRSNGVDMNHS